MTHAALQDHLASLRGLAAVIRKHGTCAPAAIEEVADRIAALSAMEGEAAGWIRVDPVKTEPAIFVTDEAERALWASLGYTLRPIAYTDTAQPPQQAVGEGEKCPDCGDSVEPNPDAEGKTRCADCWGKNLAATHPTPSPGPQIKKEPRLLPEDATERRMFEMSITAFPEWSRLEHVAFHLESYHRHSPFPQGSQALNFAILANELRKIDCVAAPTPPQPEAQVSDEVVRTIACELARIDGFDPEDERGGLYDLRWSGGPTPEPLGDSWNIDYLPKAERIARAALTAALTTSGRDGDG